MRTQVVVRARKPREPLAYDTRDDIPKNVHPGDTVRIYAQEFPMCDPPWGKLDPWLGVRSGSFRVLPNDPEPDNVLFDHDPYAITSGTITQITNGLTHRNQETVIQTALELISEFGFLGFPALSFHHRGEPLAAWTGLGKWVSCIVTLNEGLRTFDRDAMIEKLLEVNALFDTYSMIRFPHVGSLEVSGVKLEAMLDAPGGFSDDQVRQAGQVALVNLVHTLGDDMGDSWHRSGLEPVLREYDGKVFVSLEASNFRAGLSTFLKYAISSGLGAGSSNMTLPKFCANEVCRLAFTPARTNNMYAGPKSSCRVEHGRGKPCLWAREKLGLA
jgi:hypothetical protein